MSEAKTWYFEIEIEKRGVNPRTPAALGGLIDLHLVYSTSVVHRQENNSVFFPRSTLANLDVPMITQKLLCAALRRNTMLRNCNNVLKIARQMAAYFHSKFDLTPEFLSGENPLRPCIHINLEVEFHDQPRTFVGTFVGPDVLDDDDKLIIIGQDLRRLGQCCGGDLMEVGEDFATAAVMKRIKTCGLPADCGDCSVCFERIDKFNVAVQTPCSHMFHESCIGRWFCTSHSCPMCRSACALSI